MKKQSAPSPRPSELELQVLSVLWRQGASTAREMLEAMPDGKKRAYTTILSVMQVMEKKGLLTHENRGPAHVYKPCVSRRQVLGPMLRSMVNNIFGGSTPEAMMHLLQETAVDPDDMSEIRRLLKEAPAKKDKPKKKGK